MGGDRKHGKHRAIFLSLSLSWSQLQPLDTTRAAEQAQAPHKHRGAARILPARKHFGDGRVEGRERRRERDQKKAQQERKMDVQLPVGSADVCV